MIAHLQSAFEVPALVLLMGAGYLVGSIPFGYLLARFVAKKDVRAAGSGNIGATNVARVVGKKLGLVTLGLDALKGAIPVLCVALVDMPDGVRPPVEALVGMSAFLGHCYPVWLKFKGGKGVATGLGVLLAFAPVAAGIGLCGFALSFAIFRLVSLSSLVAAATLCVVFVGFRDLDGSIPPLAVMLGVLLWRHRTNMARIWRRQEMGL